MCATQTTNPRGPIAVPCSPALPSVRPKVLAAALAITGCLLGVAPAAAQTFGDENRYTAVRIAPTTAGAAAAHELLINLAGGEYEPLSIQIDYPLGFVFNGFEATAGANGKVGTFTTTNLPDQMRFGDDTFAIRARDHSTAYVDVTGDGVYTRGPDMRVTHAIFFRYQSLTIYLPFGGDGDHTTLTTLADARVGAHLVEGIFTNPAGEATYPIRTMLMSVDPDTDNFNDGEGDGPLSYGASLASGIGASTLCAEAPSALCRRAEKVKFSIKNGEEAKKDSLKWSFSKGEAATFEDFGTPDVATSYAFCIYDSTATLGQGPTAFEIPADGVKWEAKAPKKYGYKDKEGSADGVTGIKLSAGVSGKSKVKLKAKGENLSLPTPSSPTTAFDLEPNLQVQLFNSDGECWSSEFVTAKKNDAEKFKTKASN